MATVQLLWGGRPYARHPRYRRTAARRPAETEREVLHHASSSSADSKPGLLLPAAEWLYGLAAYLCWYDCEVSRFFFQFRLRAASEAFWADSKPGLLLPAEAWLYGLASHLCWYDFEVSRPVDFSGKLNEKFFTIPLVVLGWLLMDLPLLRLL